MPQYRVTMVLNYTYFGWSETYYTGDVSASVAASKIQALWALRRRLLYNTVNLLGVRISTYGSQRHSALLVPPYDYFPGTAVLVSLNPKGNIDPATAVSGPDQLRAALQFRLTWNTDQTKLRYLAGIPDAVSTTESGSYDPSKWPQWHQTLTQFFAMLESGDWFIEAQSTPETNPIFHPIGIAQQQAAPGLLGVVLPSTPAPNFNQGDKLRASHFRPPKGLRGNTINGTWYVASIDKTSVTGAWVVYLRNSAGIDPDTVRFTDKSFVSKLAKQLFPIQNATWVRVGIHKRGRPSISPRGRRLTYKSLDP